MNELVRIQAYVISSGQAALRMRIDDIVLSHIQTNEKLQQIHEELRKHYHVEQNGINNSTPVVQSESPNSSLL
jgi:hypothetical protein